MMYDIIIIGAGPAGLTAALYARRAMKNVLVLEAFTPGGQIINTIDIENYPAAPHISGVDFSNNLFNQVKELECDIKFERALDIKNLKTNKQVITKDNIYEAKTIIIATGNENRKLGLENEEDLLGHGVSYCATCDGSFFKGKDVAVVGGGNTAIEEALYLSDICKSVSIIHRRDEFRADETLVGELKSKNNIEFIYNSSVTKLNTEKSSEKLGSIEVTNNDGSIKTIEVSGIFIAVGRVPENQNFAKIINLDKTGYVIAGEDCHTNVEGIFVAGDNRVKSLRQLVTATSDGAVAATEAIKYINKNRSNASDI